MPQPNSEPIEQIEVVGDLAEAAIITLSPTTEIRHSPVTGDVKGSEITLLSERPEGIVARQAIAALMCTRFSASERFNCSDKSQDDVTIACLVADTQAAENIYALPTAFTRSTSTKVIARERQRTAYSQRQMSVGATSTGQEVFPLIYLSEPSLGWLS